MNVLADHARSMLIASSYWLPLLLACALALPCAADTWVPVRDISLQIEPGSALDFSKITPKHPIDDRLVINNQGQLAQARNPSKPLRFLIGSLGFITYKGGFPSHELIDQYVQQYRLHGYNMARLDFVELTLMEGRKNDFDFDHEQMDRFNYLVAALKKNGIYLILNGLSNDNGAYGGIKQRWTGQRNLMRDVYFSQSAQAHWKKLLVKMYGGINPYTGISILKDPVLAGIILVNENNLVFMNRNGDWPEAKVQFAIWLKEKYGNNEALKSAWGGELKADENLDKQRVNLAPTDAWVSHRMADTQLFFFETEKKAGAWMTQFLREQGFEGMTTAYNFWHQPAAQASRGQFDWVDMHNYFGDIAFLSDHEISVAQNSLLKNNASYIRELAAAKHWGKVYTVSEHGQIFWNQYRRENGLAIPAYAALQSWDGICQHEGAVNLSYAPTVGRKDAINPYAVGADPIARATETLAALLFLRGDVEPAKHTLVVKFNAEDAFKKSAHYGNTPSDVSKLGLVTGLALLWEGSASGDKQAYDGITAFNQLGMQVRKNGTLEPVKSNSNLGVKLDNAIKKYTGNLAYQLRKINAISDERWASRVQYLRDAQWLNDSNETDAKSEIYQSDTGQILLDAQQGLMTVTTPKTEAVVFDTPKMLVLPHLQVLSAESSALVAVSSLDVQPLSSSKRMLIVLATDARNSDMQFKDANYTLSTNLGHLPVLIKSNKVRVALKNTNKSLLKVYSLDLRGHRQDSIKTQQTDTGVEFTLDISRLTHGGTTFFEVST